MSGRRRFLGAGLGAGIGSGLGAGLGAKLAAAAAAADPRPAGTGPAPSHWRGGWVGADADTGHAWRDGRLPAGGPVQRVAVAVVGAGVAGLAAARALRAAGIDDHVVFDLEAEPGGNARGHVLGGQPCPLGAHYLPLPDGRNEDLLAWLAEIGLLRHVAGRPRWNERHLCHAPQERIFVPGFVPGLGPAGWGAAPVPAPPPAAGRWHEGLLPLDALPASEQRRTLTQWRRLAAAMAALARAAPFRVPTHAAAWAPAHAALDRQTFAGWLDGQGIDAPLLRAHLDYCCRDDYGAGAAAVSAWAGVHYFASRHGQQGAAPGQAQALAEAGADAPDPVLTWPEGNAFLTRALAAGDARIRSRHIVSAIDAGRHEVALQGWDAAARAPRRWVAQQVVLAVPLFIAARLLRSVPAPLAEAAPRLRRAPWLVSNLLLSAPLLPRSGAAPAWDNVLLGSPALGYVNARHQSLSPDAPAAPPVLTHYWALGGASAAADTAQRRRLQGLPWQAWAQAVVADLAVAHPDLPAKLQQIDLMRYGHAMAIPTPGLRGSAALAALLPGVPRPAGRPARLHFAHADLSAYSVFEEAFAHGLAAGRDAARALSSPPTRSPA